MSSIEKSGTTDEQGRNERPVLCVCLLQIVCAFQLIFGRETDDDGSSWGNTGTE